MSYIDPTLEFKRSDWKKELRERRKEKNIRRFRKTDIDKNIKIDLAARGAQKLGDYWLVDVDKIESSVQIRKFEDKLRIELIAKHNLYLSFSELRTIRQAIREGNLWELVEQRVRTHPNLVKALNLIKLNNPFFENFEKIYKNHGRLMLLKRALIDL